MITSALQAALLDLLGDCYTDADAVRETHAADKGWLAARLPDAVCFPRTEADVVAIVKLCRAHGTPIVPFGAGSSIEGSVIPARGGVTVDMSRLNAVVAVHPDDLDATVEAGVTRRQLNEMLAPHGLFFPVDPGADATFAGMASTRASGTNAVRYGTMRENVMALRVVLPSGEVIQTAHRARKSSAGYDLTRLFVGAEGTLGVITQVTVKLYAIPQAISAAVVSFPDVASAVNTVIRTIQRGVPVARIELIDDVQIDAVNRYSGLSYPVRPTLFLEFHGTDRGVDEQAEIVAGIARQFGCGDFQWTADRAERDRLWHARHNAYYAALALRPGCKGIASDVCVPISALAECIRSTKEDLAGSFLTAPLLGHVGDGNFHLLFLIDPDNPEEMAEAKRLNGRLVERALAVGGTCTGEHGIGLAKQEYLRQEMGPALDAMRLVKQALDPDGIMNPGKIFPAADFAGRR